MGMGCSVVFTDVLPGFGGRATRWETSRTLAEAFADPKLSDLSGIVFVATFLVLAVRARLKARG